MSSKITNESYDNEESYFEGMSNWYNNGITDVRIKNILSPIEHYLTDNIKVLDVGTGVGTFAIEVSKRINGDVIAVDFSETALKFARNNAKKAGIVNEPKFIKVKTVEDLSVFGDNEFDVVIAADIIEHIYKPVDFLNEIYRVLKPNGKAVFETPNINFRTNLKINYLDSKYKTSKPIFKTEEGSEEGNNELHPFHINMYTIDKLIDELTLSKLSITYIDTNGWWLENRGIDRFITKLLSQNVFEGKFLEEKNTDIICVATKDISKEGKDNNTYKADIRNEEFYSAMVNETDLLIADVINHRNKVLEEEFRFVNMKENHKTHKIKISVLDKNPLSQGNEFWLYNIYSDIIGCRNFLNINRNGSWDIIPNAVSKSCDSLFSNQVGDCIEFEMIGNELYLDVLNHNWSGKISISIDGDKVETYDLYSEEYLNRLLKVEMLS
ncbi:class I SAM-dependent methyltransferase [Clostridium sp. YIM B02555]|uniref:class I SAM-dependent methyltransferase n=1 Tax=Clostridium sp. YIM B02555 TaxID=2911968 RepID=UPI001EEE9B9C|nr:class I SAM-dependent methyltransferase [Clostridium sp. YIM B02555]